jgi:hypothetical protein
VTEPCESDEPMQIECPLCKGAKYLTVVWDDLPGSPERLEPCPPCTATGMVKLTSSEERTFRKFNEAIS